MAESVETRLDIEVLKQFRIIFKSVRRHFQAIEQVCGISGAQLWALAKIEQSPKDPLNKRDERAKGKAPGAQNTRHITEIGECLSTA